MSAHQAYETLKSLVLQGKRETRVRGVGGLGVAHLAAALSEKRPLLLVAPDNRAAEDLLRDVRFWLGPDEAERARLLPLDERTPYHASSPDPLVVMERAATLFSIATGAPLRVVVTTAPLLASRVVPFSTWQDMALLLEKGEEVDRDELLEKLNTGGYSRVAQVEDPGTFAVRGSIIDVYWAGRPLPLRIDLFGDEIESLKFFNPETQRTVERVDQIFLGPAREVHLREAVVGQAKKRLRDLADDVEFPTRKLKERLADLDNGIPFFGIEGLLPAFHPQLERPLQMVKQAWGAGGFSVLLHGPEDLRAAMADFSQDMDVHYGQALARGDLCFPLDAFVDVEGAEADLEEANTVILETFSVTQPGGSTTPEKIELNIRPTDAMRQEILRQTIQSDAEEGAAAMLRPLIQHIKRARELGHLVLLPVSSLGGTDRLKELLGSAGLQVRVMKENPPLDDPDLVARTADPSIHAFTYVARPADPVHGADLPHLRLTLIAEEEVFGRRARRAVKGKKGTGFKTSLADLEEGDFVVHVDHGVGRFEGLTRLNVRGVEQDVIQLVYGGEDKLYLPVHRINLIQRYSGAEGRAPRLDRLGGTGWATKKKKVKQAALAMAQDLLQLYAKRELVKREAFHKPDAAYWEFEALFAFEPTPDQQKAVDDVIGDMNSEKPMVWQNRSGHAWRDALGAQRQTGGGIGPHHGVGPTAFSEFFRTVQTDRGHRGVGEPISLQQGNQGVFEPHPGGQGGCAHRHPSPAFSRCQLQEPRPGGGGRRTAFWGQGQRAPQEDAHPGRHSDHVGHPHSAHPADEFFRGARSQHHRDASPGSARHSHLDHAL
jgi:transcription-repair coupling factor (superfamily II helicase)